ncbi:MAG: serine/threonine protein kinase [Pirellulales bacterium]|nr:serine/threonine protein kinase [Pirellulales bacterium]
MPHPDPDNEQVFDEYSTHLPEEEEETLAEPAPDEFATRATPKVRVRSRPVRYESMVRGDQIGDFVIQRLLGRGSFGAVYLARELLLDRLVALKVVLPAGQRATAGEGKNLARLKHPNIVGVFGESKDAQSGCSLLWMQFVDGSTLATVIEQLHRGDVTQTWNENDLLRLLHPADSAAQQASQSTRSMEMVCRIGEKLAEALAHAHQRGITHRDIKPANILVDRDGTALLADFNLAEHDSNDDPSHGGTIAYMPPEQLAQMLGEKEHDPVGPRSDLYSLGVVLWELACGCRPLHQAESQVSGADGLARLREYLRLRREDLPVVEGELPIGLVMVLARALKANPSDRYPSASAMATALRGLSELERARRGMPIVAGRLQFIRRNLFLIILIFGLLPHFAASILQSVYNSNIQGMYSDAFRNTVIVYNLVFYPTCVGWLAWQLVRFRRGYRRLLRREPLRRGELRKLRRRLLNLPSQFMIASAIGWFPGAILFPLLISWFAGKPLPAEDSLHLFVSFIIAGTIATTYSYSSVLYVVICHGYRACWQSASHYRNRVKYELAHLQNRIAWLSILAGVLPLAAAALLMIIELPLVHHWQASPEYSALLEQSREMDTLLKLVIALIVFGAIGLYVVQKSSARMIGAVRSLMLSDD